jgi:O-antigen/teichoic acid export membrane protein
MIKQLIANFLTSGHERTLKAKKNIITLIALKGYSVAVSMALIPLTLKLLDEYKYGVWITLFNVLSWISIFDIGIGNGLRNKFAEAMAKNRIEEAREYVSTAYLLMVGISITLILVFIIPWMFVDWGRVFNVQGELGHEVFLLVGIAFLLTSFQFSLKLIGTLLTASHQPAISALLGTIANTLVLLIFIVGKGTFKENLLGIGFIYTLIPLLVFAASSIYLFKTRFKNVSPQIISFRKNKVNSLFSLGMRFFIIQIAVVVIFSTDSMIITHTLSPEDVTSYNIVLRYFGVVTMAAGIILTPLWSAYTEAAAKNDFAWIKSLLKKQLKAMIAVLFLVFVLFSMSKILIPFWLQEEVSLSYTLLIGMAVYTIISVWNNIFSFILNGLSITNVQTYTSIAGIVINIPLSIYFAHKFGNGGVILATIISLSFFAFFGANQVLIILKTKNK